MKVSGPERHVGVLSHTTQPFPNPRAEGRQVPEEGTLLAEKEGQGVDFRAGLEEAAERLTRAVRAFDYKLHFKIHEDTKRVMVQVIDEESGEVVNEVPPEKILNLVAEIWRLVGLLVDEKV